MEGSLSQLCFYNDPCASNQNPLTLLQELLRIIYCEPEDKLSLKDTADLPGRVTSGNKGVKCIQVRPDGQHIATGDRIGNLAYVNCIGEIVFDYTTVFSFC